MVDDLGQRDRVGLDAEPNLMLRATLGHRWTLWFDVSKSSDADLFETLLAMTDRRCHRFAGHTSNALYPWPDYLHASWRRVRFSSGNL